MKSPKPATPATEGAEGAATKEESRTDISLIAENVGPDGVRLFLGGVKVASDADLLARHDITAAINCAVNLDINHVTHPAPEPDGSQRLPYGHGPVRTYKVRLVDGDGNPPGMLVASYFLLHGALHQHWPETESYPNRRRGNVLVYCRGGRSRSVIVVALYLHVSRPDAFPRLEDAVDLVRRRRSLDPNEYHEAPKPMLIAAAELAATHLRRIEGQLG
ncbi:MAG: dual specificity protein phosphatase family protein [Proteobacteria bacterium]|nr:dual specificity protein phosphatase family protein [Pseudomonadota bacterium]